MRKRIIATLLVISLIAGFTVVGSSAEPAVADTSWYDSSQSEFIITTPNQLLGISSIGSTFSGKTIKLGADIVFNEGDAAAWGTKIPKNVWIPIASFAGTFDGQGHTVSGLYCRSANNAGMFKNTSVNSVIKNFRLVNSYFATTSGTSAAAISCSGGGTFEKIYSNAVVRCADHHAGGIFGVATSSVTVRECWFDGIVTLSMRYAAGIVGNGNGKTVLIEHCLNSGEIYTSRNTGSNAHIGGISGRNDASTTIVDCLNTGRVHSAMTDRGATDVLGSIFGACTANNNSNGVWTSKVNITNTWATTESCDTLVGANWSEDPDQQTDFNGIPASQLLGYNGYHNTTLDFANYWAVVGSGSPIPKCFADDVPGASTSGPISPDTSWYNSALSEYVITTPAQLLGVAYAGSNFSGKTIKLGADIVFNEGDAADWKTNIPKNIWTPITNFAGTFNGQGHTVSGLYCVAESGAGLFGSTSSAANVKDFRLVNSYFAATSGNSAAAVSSYGGGTFEKIYSNAIVDCAAYHAGGIFGVAGSSVTVRECWFDGKITLALRYAAGIVGNGNGKTVLIEHCLNSGEIYTSRNTGSNAHIGGISGRNDASTTIVDCLNTGRVHSAMTDRGAADVLGSIFGACTANNNSNGVWTSKVNITNTWATTESCDTLVGANWSEDPDQQTDFNDIPASQLLGYNGYHNTTLDFVNYWAVVTDGCPIPQCFADDVPGASTSGPISPDTSWYNPSLSEYVITTPAQLLGIACAGTNFSGKTIKLGADITFNTGSSASWAESIPKNIWTPITNFAGTFDGQGHTVSGLYCVVESGAGMFKNTSVNSVIKDFRLVNSYFATTSGVAAAAVSCSGGGTFEKIYSNAIVDCADHHAGGIFAFATSSVTVRECWFDGIVTLSMRYAAGIVGNGNGKTVLIEHCLNSGEIYTSRNTGSNAHIGGISGRNDASTTIVDCLNTGRVHSAMTDRGATDVLGSIFGACAGNTNSGGTWTSKLNVTNTWATAESCKTLIGANSSKDPSQQKDYHGICTNQIVGYGGYYNTTLDFANYWAVDLEGTPILKHFASSVPALYDLPAPGIGDAEVSVGQYFGPKWTVTLNVPEGFSKSDITLGLLACATKAVPKGHLLSRADTGFEYRGETYPVVDLEAVNILPSGNDTIVAEFVITGLDASNIRTNISVRPYAVYPISGVEAEVYGATKSTTFYTDAKTLEAGALKDQVDALLAPIDAVIGTNFTVSKDWSTMDLFEEIPALLASGTTILPAEDYGMGNYVIEVSGARGLYAGYVALLESCGFTKVVDNGSGLKGAVFTANLVKDDLMVCVTEVKNKNKVYISAMWDQPLSAHLLDDFKNTVRSGAVTTLHQKELYWWGDCYIIQLKNSHFIVVDGATNHELGYLLDYLESLVEPGEKPVIEAWCNTHLHLDHFYLLKQFLDHPDWVDRVFVEGFYFSEPSDRVKDVDPGVYAEIEKEHMAINTLKTTAGTTPEIYRPQTGQRYYFCDITMDIMLSQEQMPLSSYTGGFNDSSTWYLFTMEGQTFLEGGDGHQACMNFMMAAYKPADLQVDFFSVLHHGANTWDVFTNWVGTFRTILYPTTAAEKAGILAQARHKNLNSKALEYFFAGEGTDVFYLPYTPGRTGTNGGHVKLPSLPEHYS